MPQPRLLAVSHTRDAALQAFAHAVPLPEMPSPLPCFDFLVNSSAPLSMLAEMSPSLEKVGVGVLP